MAPNLVNLDGLVTPMATDHTPVLPEMHEDDGDPHDAKEGQRGIYRDADEIVGGSKVFVFCCVLLFVLFCCYFSF